MRKNSAIVLHIFLDWTWIYVTVCSEEIERTMMQYNVNEKDSENVFTNIP